MVLTNFREMSGCKSCSLSVLNPPAKGRQTLTSPDFSKTLRMTKAKDSLGTIRSNIPICGAFFHVNGSYCRAISLRCTRTLIFSNCTCRRSFLREDQPDMSICKSWARFPENLQDGTCSQATVCICISLLLHVWIPLPQGSLCHGAHTGMMQTVGTELSIVEVKENDGGMDVKLQLLDTGGHPAQQSLVEQGLGTGHDFCCLVYSVADRASFAAVKEWHRLLSAKTTTPSRPLKGVLVACKTDLPSSMHQVWQANNGNGLSMTYSMFQTQCENHLCRLLLIKVGSWQVNLDWTFHKQVQLDWPTHGNLSSSLHS